MCISEWNTAFAIDARHHHPVTVETANASLQDIKLIVSASVQSERWYHISWFH